MAASAKPNEIRLIRTFDAPVATVWAAWTETDQVAQWWGPRGFSLTTHSKDLRPGGHWHYTMHGPDGTDYPNKTFYHEVETCRKLVYDHGGNDERAPMFRVLVVFEDIGGKTQMDMTMALATPEAAAETRAHVKKAGGESTWDRLGEYLDKQKTGKEKFVITRSFAAPIDVLFDMWVNPIHFSQWLPPLGFTMEFIRVEVAEGKTSFYAMTGENGMKMYGRVRYVNIEPPSSLVYEQQFCDEHENISRHPFAPIWPETMLTTVTMTAEGSDQTRVTINWEPAGQATPEEIAVFAQAKPGMTQGWTGSFEKLENYIAGNSKPGPA